jgi:hypothetical protein
MGIPVPSEQCALLVRSRRFGMQERMVRESSYMGKTIYLCSICGVGYADITSANECEMFYRSHNGCSLEITRRAVYKPT